MMITWTLILKVCGGIITLGGATTIIVKVIIGAINKLNEPIDEIRNKMEEMKQTDKKGMELLEKHEKRLNEHDKQINGMSQDIRMIMKSVASILAHIETGNNTGKVAEMRKKLDDYIIDKKY